MQNSFALELYRALAGAAPDLSLFFSPYSVFSALAMTAEGARRETLDEMGRALRLPAELRVHGADVGERPWNLAPVHAAFGELAARLETGSGIDPAAEARVDSLREALVEAKRALWEVKDWKRAETREREIVEELNALQERIGGYELRVGNALWADASYVLAPEFLRVLSVHYATGGARSTDFRHDPEGARVEINGWVADRTAQRIPELLPQGSVDPLTRLVLASAIWFKGRWAETFEEKSTKEGPFLTLSGASAVVPLMSNWLEGGRYAAMRPDDSAFPTPREIELRKRVAGEDPTSYPGPGGLQLAELPYLGGSLAMVVVLPRSPDGLTALEQRLDAGRLAAWFGHLEAREIHVVLPRFRLEQGRELGPSLRGMGLVRAFEAPSVDGGAQFDGVATSIRRDDAVFVSDVIHGALLDVDEKGTEAAAATLIARAMGMSLPRKVPFVPTFRADHPFLFLIRDVPSGTILFMGRYTGP